MCVCVVVIQGAFQPQTNMSCLYMYLRKTIHMGSVSPLPQSLEGFESFVSASFSAGNHGNHATS